MMGRLFEVAGLGMWRMDWEEYGDGLDTGKWRARMDVAREGTVDD